MHTLPPSTTVEPPSVLTLPVTLENQQLHLQQEQPLVKETYSLKLTPLQGLFRFTHGTMASMKHHLQRAFTLVELIVVVGLIAIILILILLSLSKNRMATRDNLRASHIETIRLGLESYRAQCGVFPATLEIDADNGRDGTCAITFGDVLSEIPTAPNRDGDSLLIDDEVPSAAVFNGYFYAGLSTSVNGPCYEYHLGAELELAENNGQDSSGFLDKDYDFEDNEGDYDSRCSGSVADFGSSSVADDDADGLYDFRSVNNH